MNAFGKSLAAFGKRLNDLFKKENCNYEFSIDSKNRIIITANSFSLWDWINSFNFTTMLNINGALMHYFDVEIKTVQIINNNKYVFISERLIKNENKDKNEV